ncbi:MAG: sulfotransferase family protein [Symploca sp. SIO2E6]|nr:sulfotransferase family protein [Symploca sp. SIO2E6]
MNKILSLWATPRSRSTAFMWMMKNRGDFVALPEPFGKSAYYSEERIFDIPGDWQPEPAYNYPIVLQQLISKSEESQLFVKDFPLYFIQIVDEVFLSLFQHTFLIRDPAQMLPSYFHKWPDLTFEETGYQQLDQLFEKVVSFTGEIPPVIDADDLVNKPISTLQVYCRNVGIPFIPEALNWEQPKESLKKMSWWDGGSWHDRVSVTKEFSEQLNPHYLDVNDSERLKYLYDLCLPYYEKLYAYRLRSSS